MRILLYCLMSVGLTVLLLPEHGRCAIIAGSSHFPATVGSIWQYNTQALTMTGATMSLVPGTETVQVQPDGIFKSDLALTNGNYVASYANYVNLGQAVLVDSTQITMTMADTPGKLYWSETTTNNSYTPSQLIFPSSTADGTHETSTSAGYTYLTGITHFPGLDVPMVDTENFTSQVVDVTVGPPESVTVPAGTFQAAKITRTITVTENGVTNPTLTVLEWYAAGVGLVKMDSPNMKRELTSYVIPTTQQLAVTFQGNGGGSVNSAPAGISCDSSLPPCTSASFNNNEVVTLTAKSNINSTFAGWNGEGCSGTGTCVVTMNSPRNVIANFDPLPAKVFILGSQTPYQLLQSAYDAAAEGNTLKPQAITFAEDPLTFRHAVNIVLAGGYDSTFQTQTGFTTVQGQVIFQSGSVAVDRLAIR